MTHSDDALRRAIEVALNEAAEAALRKAAKWTAEHYHGHAGGLLEASRLIRAISPDDILKKVKDDERN